jgi:hypothetical protein
VANRLRVVRSYAQRLAASPNTVFPLLCPVREAEWLRGWRYSLVHSASGVAELGCVFMTPHRHGGTETVWVVTEYEPPRRIGFVRVTPGAAAVQIAIELTPIGAGETRALVRYTYTALSDSGEAELAAAGEEAWRAMMQEWESSLNHYLATGRKLPEGA